MSGNTPANKAPKSFLNNLAKLEARTAEKRSRQEAHEEDALAHNRTTKSSRARFASFAERKTRYNKIHDDAEARIEALRAEIELLEQKKRDMVEKIGEMEEKEGEEAGRGEVDAEVSEKYRRFLEMESDELDL